MLCLSRKPQEKIVMRNHATGERIVILMLRTQPAFARLGIDAPDTWDIVREELLERDVAVAWEADHDAR